MGLFDSRAVTGGLVGACVLSLLRQTQRRTPSGSEHEPRPGVVAQSASLLGGAAAAAAYYSLAGASSRPVLTGAFLGAAAGLVLPRRRSAPTTLTSVALHSLAGATSGAVYAWLSDENWPAEDFGEAFFP